MYILRGIFSNKISKQDYYNINAKMTHSFKVSTNAEYCKG